VRLRVFELGLIFTAYLLKHKNKYEDHFKPGNSGEEIKFSATERK
jgi:hypothetical protein